LLKNAKLTELPQTSDALLEALEFGIRALSLREMRLRDALNEGDRLRMNEEEARAAGATVALSRYAKVVAGQCRASTDARVQEKFAQFRKQFLDLDWDRFDGWARLATNDPRVFPLFTEVIASWHAVTVRYLVPQPDEFVARLDRYLRRWLEAVNAHPPSTDLGDRVRQLFERLDWILNPAPIMPAFEMVVTGEALLPKHLEKLKPVADALAASPSSIVSAQGKSFRATLDKYTGRHGGEDMWSVMKSGNFNIDRDFEALSYALVTNGLAAFLSSPQEQRSQSQNSYDAKTQIEEAVLQNLGADASSHWPDVSNDAGYLLWDQRITGIKDPGQRLAAYIAEIDFMLDRKFIYSPSVESASELALKQRLPSAKLVAQVDKIIAATEDAGFSFSRIGLERSSIKTALLDRRKALTLSDSIAKKTAAAPWQQPVRLLSLEQFPQIEVFGRMIVADDAVYAFGTKSRNVSDASKSIWGNEVRLFLVRVPWQGNPSIVNQATFFTPYSPPSLPVIQAQLVGSTLYALIDTGTKGGRRCGVFAIPLDGKPITRLDEKPGLPDGAIESFAVAGNKLVLGLPGYIVAADLVSNQITLLASSRRTDKQSELDGGAMFHTKFTILDPARRRIVLVVQPGSASEFWSVDPSKGRLAKLFVAKTNFSPNRMDGSGDGVVLFSDPCCIHAFHLDSVKLELLCVDSFCGGRIDEQFPLGRMKEREWMIGPHLIYKGFLWSGGAFGRIAFADQKAERFPPVSPPDPETVMRIDPSTVGCFAPADNGKKLVFGTPSGVWLLALRETK
jgi:hypothetical protein